MKTITASFKIVTPMFLGNAESSASGVREMSVKGALAFWYRALFFGKIFHETSNLEDALIELRKREHQIFGGPNGQAGVLIKLVEEDTTVSDIWKKASQSCKLNYLALGLVNHRGQMEDKRSFLEPNGTFKLKFLMRPRLSSRRQGEFIKCLNAFGLLGGLGARVRRGWGSISMTECEFLNIDSDENPVNDFDLDGYKNQLSKIVGDAAKSNEQSFPISAFGLNSQVIILPPKQGALDALNDLATALQKYRSWYGDKKFEDDHHWFKDFEQRNYSNNTLPERAAFGLPHNYFTNNGPNGKYSLEVSTVSKEMGRRASPLLFHIHEINDRFFPIAIYLPSQFLPANENRLSVGNKTKDFSVKPETIGNFLDLLAGPNGQYRISIDRGNAHD